MARLKLLLAVTIVTLIVPVFRKIKQIFNNAIASPVAAVSFSPCAIAADLFEYLHG